MIIDLLMEIEKEYGEKNVNDSNDGNVSVKNEDSCVETSSAALLVLSEEIVINADGNSIDEVVKSSEESHNEKSKDEVDLKSDTNRLT